MRYGCKWVVLLATMTSLIAATAIPGNAQEDYAKAITALKTQKSVLKREIGIGIWSNGRIENNDQRTKLMELYNVSLRLVQIPGFEADITSERNSVLGDLRKLGNAASRDAYLAVVQHLTAELPKFFQDDKQRMVVRYNAMLIYGELNSQEAPPVGVGKASPLPAAFPLLLSTYQDDQVPAAIRVAALIGLHRHASLGIADKNARDALRAEMVKTFTEQQPPKNATSEAHDWLRMRAAEALGYLGTTGTAPENTDVLAALLATINNKSANFALRAEAARAMQMMDFSVPANINTPLVARALAGLVVDAIGTGLDRTMLKHVLNCARLGLTGPDPDPLGRTVTNNNAVAKVGSPESKQMIAVLAKQFEDLNKKIDRTDDSALATDITANELDAWLQQFPLQNTQLTARN